MQEQAKIFLSYARVDIDQARDLYQKLETAGFKPWIDEKDILPGEDWGMAIEKAIRGSHFFIACLSPNSVRRRGWIQKEINAALEIWNEKLSDDIYLIPLRLSPCALPDKLARFQSVELYAQGGWDRLVQAIRVGMERMSTIIATDDIIHVSVQRNDSQGQAPKSGMEIDMDGHVLRLQTQEKPDDMPLFTRSVIDTLGHEMQYIPSGKAILGDLPKSRLVDVPEFFIDRFPITNSDYERFVLETAHELPFYNAEWAADYNWIDPKWHRTRSVENSDHLYPLGQSNLPVVLITWEDAQAYCKWRSEKTRMKVRLPTTEEWEKSARGIDGRRFPWGKEYGEDKCNLQESSIGKTTPVIRYQDVPSPFKVVDLIGNVWEWTLSERKERRRSMILKGGSWKISCVVASSSAMRFENVDFKSNDVGFRCVAESTF